MFKRRSLMGGYLKRDNMYPKILFSLVALICITILVTSLALYIVFGNIVQYQIFVSESENLSQASYSADVLFNNVKMTAKQVYYDRRITILRIYKDLNIDELSDILTDLETFKYHNDFISSIYIYNGKSKTVATAAINPSRFNTLSSFYDKEALEFIRNYTRYPCLVPIPRKIPIWASGKEQVLSDGYTFIFYENPGNMGSIDSAVILNIDESWMRQAVNQLSPGSSRDTSIIDGNGRTLVNSVKYPMLTDLSGRHYIKKVLAQNSASGYFIDEIDGIKSLIIYVPYKKLGWTYVRTISYDQIMQKVDDLQHTTFLIVSAILAAALFLAFLQSRSLYRPIGKVVSKLNALEAERRSSYLSRRQECLKGILLGKIRMESEKGRNLCREFDILLEMENEFRLLLFTIDGYKEFSRNNGPEDRSLYKFGIMNILSELFSEAFRNEAVDSEENAIVLILNRDGTKAFSDEQLREIIQDSQLQVEKHLGLSMSCFASPAFNGADQIQPNYDEIFYTSNYRLLYGRKCILFGSTLSGIRNTEYVYPLKNEKLLLEALIAGNTDETKRVFNEIIDKARLCSYTFFTLTVNRLIFAILGALTDTALGHGPHINISSLADEISRMESVDDIKLAFYRIFDDLEARTREKKKHKYDAITEKIISIVNEKYDNPNLSIQMIADSLSFSPGYTGMLFKQATGKSIIDYINEIRIGKAKDLLVSTTLNVNVIFQKTGFTNAQYFRKVFKKNFGVSPNDMRRSDIYI
jgi:AraC-like DNA-binding protein